MTYDVLMPAQGMSIIAERVEERATLYRPWQTPDPAATLAEIAPRIRALVVTHHTPRIDDAYMAGRVSDLFDLEKRILRSLLGRRREQLGGGSRLAYDSEVPGPRQPLHLVGGRLHPAVRAVTIGLSAR